MTKPLSLEIKFADDDLKKLAKLVAAQIGGETKPAPKSKTKPAAADDDGEDDGEADDVDGETEDDGEDDGETEAEDSADNEFEDDGEDSGDEDEADEPKSTKEDVLNAMRALQAATSNKVAIDTLKKVGGVTKGLSELKPAKFDAVIEACKKKTAAAKAAAKKKPAGRGK
jgi:cobalamin biosynthesis protein CobT